METDLDKLRTTIEHGNWFRRLGEFTSRDGFVAIADHAAWVSHTAACAAEEFGLPVEQLAAGEQSQWLQETEWLPTSHEDEDPFHGGRLIEQVRTAGRAELLKQTRLELSKLALQSTTEIPPSPWLQVGAVDYTQAARQGLVFAIRMAVAEVVAGKPDVWRACCDLYADGRWPAGRLADGRVVML